MDLTMCKQYLSLDAADTSRDALMASLTDAAVGDIENELGYALSTHPVTQQSAGSSIIPFTDLPVSSLVVKYRDDLTDVAGASDRTLVAWLDYYPFPRHIELRNCRTTEPRIILSYTAGYATLPAPLEQAARSYVAYFLRLVAQLQPNEQPDTRLPREVDRLLTKYHLFTTP